MGGVSVLCFPVSAAASPQTRRAQTQSGKRSTPKNPPAAEKSGIFCPRAIEFITSIVEMPVWIISSG